MVDGRDGGAGAVTGPGYDDAPGGVGPSRRDRLPELGLPEPELIEAVLLEPELPGPEPPERGVPGPDQSEPGGPGRGMSEPVPGAQPRRQGPLWLPRHRRPRPEWDVLGAIAAGGALGGLARWGIENAFAAPPDTFPWATFIVNISGSFALSFLLVLIVEVFPPSRYARPFIAVGFLGAYTTFSTWMIEADQLVSHGEAQLGVGYLFASMFAGFAAVSFGLIIGRAVVLGSSGPAAEED